MESGFKAMFGIRNMEPGKGEGKKMGKKEKAREGKIIFFFLFGYSWKTQGKKIRNLFSLV